MKTLMVLDGNSIVNRAFYGVNQNLTTHTGQPTNAILGFINILNKFLDEVKPDALCVTFDRKAPTFRHLAYEGYKAKRKGMPEELASQMPILKDILWAMNIPMYELDGWEADDLLGTISVADTNAGWNTVIVTGDRDALQLITEHTTVKLVSTSKGKTTSKDMTQTAFEDEYGFPPIHLIDLKALMGDTSDSIPGVKGIGEVTALALVRHYHTIAAIYEALPNLETEDGVKAKPGVIKKIEEGKEQAELSYDLARIRTDAPISFHPEENVRTEVNQAALYDLFLELEFSKLIEKYQLSPSNQGSDPVQVQQIQSTYSSEIVKEQSRMEELLALWREKAFVSVMALPSLDVVCVTCQTEENHNHSAILLSSKLSHYTDHLKKLFSAEIRKVVHGAKELCKQLLDENITPDGILFDTELAAYLLSPTDGSYSLEKLGLSYYKMELPKEQAYLAPEAFSPLSNQEESAHALSLHCALIGTLYQSLSQQLEKLGMMELYNTIELPLCIVLAEMERVGVMVDRNALLQYGQELAESIQAVQKTIYQMAGEEFNINSPQQLGHILFEVLALPPVKKTKTGYSTNAEVLEKIQGLHPIVPQIQEYRQLTKLKSTYADGLGKVIGADGRIHTCFQNTVTATGRLSSTEPNLQNIPIRTPLGAKLRYMFVAEEGNVLVDADYSQIELRLLAHMAGDEHMIEAFRSGEDFHTVTAARVFGVDPEQVTSQMRRSAKAVNFGIIYGISPFSLSQDIGVSVSEAKQYMEQYFHTYPKVKAYMDMVVEQAKRDGYVSTLMGRRRWIPELKSSNFNTRSFGERVALNTPIQGTAADLIKLAMIRVRNRLRKEGLQGQLVLQVHDELIVECPERERESVASLVQEEMEQTIELSVALQADTASGNSWGAAH